MHWNTLETMSRKILQQAAVKIDLSTRPERKDDYEDWVQICLIKLWQLWEDGRIETDDEKRLDAFLRLWASRRAIEWLRKEYRSSNTSKVNFCELLTDDQTEGEMLDSLSVEFSAEQQTIETLAAKIDRDEWLRTDFTVIPVISDAQPKADDFWFALPNKRRNARYQTLVPKELLMFIYRDEMIAA